MGQRSGGNIEDGEGAVPPGGNAPSGESRDSSTEQPRKGGTQQWASPRGEAPRAGECPGPLCCTGHAGSVAVSVGFTQLMPSGWMDPTFIYPCVRYLGQPFFCLSPCPPDLLLTLCLSQYCPTICILGVTGWSPRPAWRPFLSVGGLLLLRCFVTTKMPK